MSTPAVADKNTTPASQPSTAPARPAKAAGKTMLAGFDLGTNPSSAVRLGGEKIFGGERVNDFFASEGSFV
jgi:hypothetical protein